MLFIVVHSCYVEVLNVQKIKDDEMKKSSSMILLLLLYFERGWRIPTNLKESWRVGELKMIIIDNVLSKI